MREFRPLSIPRNAHPLVRTLFEEMNRQQLGVLDLAERSGVNKNTLRDWRTRTIPTVDNIEACFSVLGFRIVASRRREAR